MMKYSTCTWDLVWTLESASPAYCKTPATFIDSIHPSNILKVNKSISFGTNSKTKVSKKNLARCLTLCQKSFNGTNF